jgi:hypothetical protein
MRFTKIEVPVIVATGIICLAIGVGIGILGMQLFGYRASFPLSVGVPRTGGQRAGGEGGRGGFRGLGPKAQLAALVAKLDQLSQKPLAVTLSEDQKKKVLEQLQGLEAKEELTDAEAGQRLDALLEALKDQQETLVAAGYRLPGQSPPRPSNSPNPFKEEKNAAALKSLQERWGKPAAK